MRFPFRRRADWALVVLDALLAALVGLLAFFLRFESQVVPAPLVRRYLLTAAALALVWPLLSRATGLYRRSALRPGTSLADSALLSGLWAGAMLAVGNIVLLSGDLSRGWIALVTFGLVLVAVGSRAVLSRARRVLVPFGIGLERYVLVGDDAAGRRLLADLTRAPGAPFTVVGVLPTGTTALAAAREARLLRADGIVLPTGIAPEEAASMSAALSGEGVDVLVAPGFGDLDLRVASIAMLHGVPLLRVAGLAPRRRAVRESQRDRARHGVAVLGTRGVPANYGGFETFAERLALRLVDGGVATTVYCRRHYVSEASPWRGVRLVTLPTIRSKYLDTVVHTVLSAVHLVATRGPRDVVLCNVANAPVLVLLRLFRRRVVLNVDGLEWRRSKWGLVGRAWYRAGEWLSVRLASVLVTDAREVQTYYRVRHDADSVMIAYGADLLGRDLPLPDDVPVVREGYALYVSRWESENNPVLVARAHATCGADLDLVMLGGATYDVELERQVRAAAGPRAHLPGAVFGDGYRGLQSGAAVYVHATEVGGTHPALIEALGAGNLCLVLDTPENREVVGSAGVLFSDQETLERALCWAAELDPGERAKWQERARRRAAECYSWDAVASAYLELLRGTGRVEPSG